MGRDDCAPSHVNRPTSEVRRRNGSLYRSSLPPLPSRRHQALFEGHQMYSDRCPHGEAQLSSRHARQRPQGQDRWLWPATAREAEGQAHVLHSRGQFREYYEKANRATGVTGELLIQQLERRLDNVAFRLGFAISRRQARQVVRHGHVRSTARRSTFLRTR